MAAEFGIRTPHTKAQCLANAAENQKRADSYRKRNWEKAAREWDEMAANWRKRAETAPE